MFLDDRSADHLVTLAVRPVSDFERVHKAHICTPPHLGSIQSGFAMCQVVSRQVPLDAL